MRYNRCSRCELNYVPEGEELCDICKRELAGKYGDDEVHIEENICPYCEKNKLELDEEMCSYCRNKKLKGKR